MDSLDEKHSTRKKDVDNENVSKENASEPKKLAIGNKVVRFTFYITYAFLMTTATITFIEAIRNRDSKIRHILNLETCISVVAAFL